MEWPRWGREAVVGLEAVEWPLWADVVGEVPDWEGEKRPFGIPFRSYGSLPKRPCARSGWFER